MIMAAEDSKKRAEEVEDYIAIQEAEENRNSEGRIRLVAEESQ